MRRIRPILAGFALAWLLLFASLASAQSGGISVTCRSGASFDNGVEVIVNQMRSGFTYTATAVGVNGFDPVLAVVDVATGDFLCSDDEAGAARYTADLPTAFAAASSLSAQVNFTHNNSSGFADISLVVGGFGGQLGEFVLILEGMAVTSADGAGDPFSVSITPGMVASGVPLSMYMLTRGQSGVDPLMYLANDISDLSPAVINGAEISCDDAGTSLCWNTGSSLENSSVTIATGRLPSWQYDSMLSIPINGLTLDPNAANNYFTFVMTSYQQSSEGQYLLAFHMGITTPPVGSGASVGGDDGKSSIGGTQAEPTAIPPVGGSAGGLSVTCSNGASFDNGIEVVVTQMRAGFTYTATAVGINGFDPVLAVVDVATGDFLCSDDESGAARYSANLPTAVAAPSSRSSQVTFTHNSSSGFADISLVVGGFGSQTGEFLLILEGMAVTSADGSGDPFAINLTPGMVASGVPLSVYMLTRGQASVDPLLYLATSGSNYAPFELDGQQVSCDDAGSSLCWNTGVRLDNSSVTIATGTLPGWQYDAMLTIPLAGLLLDPNPANNYLTFIMTSYQQSSEGQYLLVFHIGTAN
jgi:hypothetical protein